MLGRTVNHRHRYTLRRRRPLRSWCAVGIAATGTLVLDVGATPGRLAPALVPDHHVRVVFTKQIADTVDAMRPLTVVSGPSANTDVLIGTR
jgi:L-lactate utilization protein LutC